MLRFIPYIVATMLTMAVPALAGPTVEDVARALDHANGRAEISKQAAILEGMPAGDAKAATQLARAHYLLGESEKDKKKRLPDLDKAIAASYRALASEPGNAYALYWKSMAQLQKADVVGGLKALKLVKEALRGLEAVAVKDPLYDNAGAYRSRGRVLMEAPSWAFLGDKKEGVRLLEKAKATAPDCLLNRLYLAEAYRDTGRKAEAKAEAEFILAAPVRARVNIDDVEMKDSARKLLADMH